MATIQQGGIDDLGVMRHYRGSEVIYFGLTDPTNGAPYANGVLNTNIYITAYFNDGTTWDIHASPPALTLTLGGAGFYRLALWGDPQGAGSYSGHDVVLAKVGIHGLWIRPVAAEFNPIYLQYEVQPEFDAQLAVTYVPGSSGSDQITGALSIYRWWSHERLTKPLTATTGDATNSVPISSLTLKLTDKDSTSNILSLTQSDFSENAFDGNLYFTKAITGITGARVLTARLSFVHKGFTYAKDLVLPARFGA